MNGRSRKSTYLLLGAGFVVGCVAYATVPKLVPPALAGSQDRVSPRLAASLDAESLSALRNLDASFASLADYVQPSVVHIKSQGTRSTDEQGRRLGAASGEGTGVIYSADGWIITNDHVVNGFDKVTVVLSNGREYPGEVRRAEDSDLAVVKIKAEKLTPAVFGNSDEVKPGQFAMAVGSPFGLDNTVTVGHVSAVGRASQIADPRVMMGGRYYPDLIQTDTAINMGNSGGPLVNIEGQVIGINSAIFSGTGGNVGIGFAIPSNQVKLIVDTLIEKGKIVRGYLGLVPENLKPYELEEKGLKGGARVFQVSPNTPASKAGLKEKDVITRMGDIAVRDQMDVRNAMLRYGPGDSVKVEYIRDGKSLTADVKLEDAAKAKEALAKQQQPPVGDPREFPDLEEFFEQRGESIPDELELPRPPVRLGVMIESVTEQTRKQFDIADTVEGAVVTSVEPGSLAERIGIEVGTVITQVGTKTITSAEDLATAMRGIKPGDTKQVKFVKKGERQPQTKSVKF